MGFYTSLIFVNIQCNEEEAMMGHTLYQLDRIAPNIDTG